MDREVYEQEKRKISKEVDLILEDILTDIGCKLSQELYSFCGLLINKRKTRAKNHGRLRDVVVYLGLKSLGVTELANDHYQTIAAGELFNIASYYQNWHLDDKSDVGTETDRKMCHIASHVFREAAHRTINNTDFEDRVKVKLSRELQQSNMSIQYGQALELTDLNFSNGAHKQTFEEFIEKYIKRCYWFSGFFYGSSFSNANPQA